MSTPDTLHPAATHPALEVKRYGDRFTPDAARVLLRPFVPPDRERVKNILGRVMSMTEEAVETQLAEVMAGFQSRHFHIERIFERHYRAVLPLMFTDVEPSPARRLLIGSHFTAEYALESAALFNPSIVPHPDQSHTPPGWMRFVMSFRATGEGHISSIEFRTGIVDEKSAVVMDRPGRFVTEAGVIPNQTYDLALFQLKLREMGVDNPLSQEILVSLPEIFSLAELKHAVKTRRGLTMLPSDQRTEDALIWLAESNYAMRFDEKLALSERVIFPISPNESNGIEDARFVRFVDEDGEVTYYATYTAYNGRSTLPQLLATRDFLTFDVTTLNGRAVKNKGMALFPRKIDGQYAMISRQDNENLFIMFSRHLHFWQETELLMRPSYPWEFIQLGNCGSPIETEAGWILLTHGVGAMRKYCIGAVLLDLHNPARVVKRLRDPLLSPNEKEREGYVPNVVYTCGALLHGRQLVIPYAMSDSVSGICSVSVDELLDRMDSV